MAITSKGVRVSLTPNSKIPDGWTPPSVTTFSDAGYISPKTKLSIPKSTVENADKKTTLTNIISNNTVGIEKQVKDIISNDFDNSKNVEFWVHFLNLTGNNAAVNEDSEFYSDAAVAYIAEVQVYVRIVP